MHTFSCASATVDCAPVSSLSVFCLETSVMRAMRGIREVCSGESASSIVDGLESSDIKMLVVHVPAVTRGQETKSWRSDGKGGGCDGD